MLPGFLFYSCALGGGGCMALVATQQWAELGTARLGNFKALKLRIISC